MRWILMRVAITGATGLVGSALAARLRSDGHSVVPISRRPLAGAVLWDPARHVIDSAALRRIDAVVNLAGENLAGGRWTEHRKGELRASRVPLTQWLSETVAALDPRPRVMASASAVGIYGDRHDEVLTEDASLGNDFLARLAIDWEAAADPARRAGIRVVHPRFGLILSLRGGALAKLLPVFRLGLGGRFGSGRQWMSWISIDDVVGAMMHSLADEELHGAVNFTSPHPVRNDEFVRTLGHALNRRELVPVPGFALRLLLGEMADGTLLSSQRVLPARLEASGYRNRHPALADALAALIGGAAGATASPGA